MMKLVLTNSMLVLLLSGCLVTRAEVGETEQTAVYGQKNSANQIEAQKNKVNQVNETVPAAPIDEKDELIRSLNGRIEELENNFQKLQKQGEESVKTFEQKLVVLQEEITKLTAQLKGEEDPEKKQSDKSDDLKSSDELDPKNTKNSEKIDKNKKNVQVDKKKSDLEKKLGNYEMAEQHFSKQEWKKAILSFNKYTDESPKGKHVPDAKYKIGLCFQELGMKEEAMAYFEEVAANYQSTEAGKKSKSRLAKYKK